jgi:secreted trypsin-like serine protease
MKQWFLISSLLALHVVTAADITSHIVGGTDAKEGEFPFFVQAGRNCGASLIWHDVVLSAAHCLSQFDDIVIVGPYRSSSTSGGAVSRDVVEKVQHPLYYGELNYDYLVAKLSEPVNETLFPPIKLNRNTEKPEDDDELMLIGFGDTFTGANSLPEFLQKVKVNVLPYDNCKLKYDLRGENVTDKLELCAAIFGGGKDSCDGDSGGPIFKKKVRRTRNKRGKVKRKIVKYVQVGITSWGMECGDSRFPGVYTRTAAASDWIDMQICTLSSAPPGWCEKIVPKGIYRIEVQYDEQPRNVFWTLKEQANGKIITGYDFEGITVKKYRSTEFLELTADTSYTLTVQSINGTGITEGFARVERMLGGRNKEFAYINGSRFTFETSYTFRTAPK